jgi:hypothetical protein
LDSDDFFFYQEGLDIKTFNGVIDKMSKIGINPSALFTEVLIKVLLKMEDAMNHLLVSPANHDYNELFYRADFLKVYELNFKEIVEMPDDDIFYVK